ncbi:MAG: hypothetical protein R3A52_26760 [Polyangiales bacterium]
MRRGDFSFEVDQRLDRGDRNVDAGPGDEHITERSLLGLCREKVD